MLILIGIATVVILGIIGAIARYNFVAGKRAADMDNLKKSIEDEKKATKRREHRRNLSDAAILKQLHDDADKIEGVSGILQDRQDTPDA